MKNPLTLEERASLTRSLAHDNSGHLSISQCQLTLINPENIPKKTELISRQLFHVAHIDRAVTFLSGEEYFYRHVLDKEKSEPIFKTLSALFGSNLGCFYMDDGLELATNEDVIYSALYNLVKNSRSFIPRENGKIRLKIKHFSGKIPDAVIDNRQWYKKLYPLKGNFVKFEVWDNGVGFPKDRHLRKFFEEDVGRQNGGFGLYFVRLVSKYLRSHISVHSEPGNTSVAIYHPLDLK